MENTQKQMQPGAALRRIDRAIHELRGCYPVLITDGPQSWLAISVEYFLDPASAPLLLFPQSVTRLIFTDIRARRLGFDWQDGAAGLPFSLLSKDLPLLLQAVDPLASPSDVSVKNYIAGWQKELSSVSKGENGALDLMKLAGLLPSAVVATMQLDNLSHWLEENHILQISLGDIAAYKEALVSSLRQVSIAKVPLKWAENVQVATFRPRYGALEHLAVVVGDPEKTGTPLVRVHSSCITGDIFGSLRCDCGEQLHQAIERMAAEGGGILLYMNQEGRGIGIANKLRAYRLQDKGMDTMDANEEIGFAGDEREFQAAACMLKHLGFSKIRLLSNNPRKVEGLRAAGIKVAGRESLSVEPNPHNESYIGTKRERFGHLS